MAIEINRSDPDPGIWFYTDDDHEKGYGLLLRVPIGEPYDKMLEQLDKIPKISKGKKVVDDVEAIGNKKSDLILDYSLMDWTGINEKGKKLPVNLANKHFVVSRIGPEVRQFYLQKCELIKKMYFGVIEEEGKN